MKYSIVYKSATGNTKILAQTIQSTWGMKDCMYFGEPTNNLPKSDIIAIGFWTDKGNCSEDLQIFLKQLHNQRIFLFGTAGFGGTQAYFDALLNRVCQFIPNDNKILATFMCQGKMPQSVRSRYENTLKSEPNNDKMKQMIKNFDQASAHPDKNDKEQLIQIISNIVL